MVLKTRPNNRLKMLKMRSAVLVAKMSAPPKVICAVAKCNADVY